MDTISTALAVLTGMLLRFGLPILVMAVAVYYLRRLDNRWQEEARRRMAETAVRPAAQTPCWEVHHCQDKEQCPAYMNPTIPCWQQFRSHEGLLKENCLDCSVFRNTPVPVKA
jgi:hypothetical protein